MSCNCVARLLCVLLTASLVSCVGPGPDANEPGDKPATQPAETQPAAGKPVAGKPGPAQLLAAGEWVELFDGKSLTGWKVPEFGGDGKVYVKDGAVHMAMGDMCTGFTFDEPHSPIGKLPRVNYELEVEGQRVEGEDFFCAVTFPVGKDHITFVPDGWGGAVTGLSCLDDFDASMNETTMDLPFKNGQWYTFGMRVTPTHIYCSVDDKEILKVARKGRRIGIRGEVEQSCPLGIATWQTHGAVRGVRVRKIDPNAVEP